MYEVVYLMGNGRCLPDIHDRGRAERQKAWIWEGRDVAFALSE